MADEDQTVSQGYNPPDCRWPRSQDRALIVVSPEKPPTILGNFTPSRWGWGQAKAREEAKL